MSEPRSWIEGRSYDRLLAKADALKADLDEAVRLLAEVHDFTVSPPSDYPSELKRWRVWYNTTEKFLARFEKKP